MKIERRTLDLRLSVKRKDKRVIRVCGGGGMSQTAVDSLMCMAATREKNPASVLVGHAALFNTLSGDLGGFRERIRPGAFTKAITEDDVRALWNHDPNWILGRNRAGTLRLTEDERGLAVEIDPPETVWARDLVASIERGDVNQMSFAFSVVADDWKFSPEGEIQRELIEVRLFDVSPVTFPAYADTDINARAAIPAHILDLKHRHDHAAEVPLELHRRRLDLAGKD